MHLAQNEKKVHVSEISYSINDKENLNNWKEVPYSGYRGFWVWGIQILKETRSPRTGRPSKWWIFKMAARSSTDFWKSYF